MKKYRFFLIFLLFIFSCCSLIKSETAKNEIILINPYKDINWDTVKRYKANLHMHTTKSDGEETPENAILLYKERGYSILAITDHYKITFPTSIEKDGVFLIPGAELITEWHDFLIYFSYRIPEGEGLGVFAHPGAYTQTQMYSADWYVEHFKKYPNIIGMEEFGNIPLWDAVLSKTMPDRPVWIFTNDDSHRKSDIGGRFNIFLIENLTEEEIKNAMISGKFYALWRRKSIVAEDEKLPVVKKLIIDEEKEEIKIECKNYNTIRWVSNGKIVGEGERINYKENPDIKKYLRIEVLGEYGDIYLNPFGIKNK